MATTKKKQLLHKLKSLAAVDTPRKCETSWSCHWTLGYDEGWYFERRLADVTTLLCVLLALKFFNEDGLLLQSACGTAQLHDPETIARRDGSGYWRIQWNLYLRGGYRGGCLGCPQPRQHTGVNGHLAEPALAPSLQPRNLDLTYISLQDLAKNLFVEWKLSSIDFSGCLSGLRQLCGRGFIKVGVAKKNLILLFFFFVCNYLL